MSLRVTASLVPIYSIILLFLNNNIYQEYNSRFHFEDPVLNDSYDFIIVGAGSAGSVVAHRLSEISDWSILLVEAGGEETIISETPLLAVTLWNTDKDWNYTTVRQEQACLEFNGICQYPRGHLLGGSSAINFMFYVRGNKFDFDNWEAQGNKGWGYDDVLPYFLKSENMTIPSLQDSPYHATGGYLCVEELRYFSPLQNYHIAAAKEVGWSVTNDYNGECQNGIAYPHLTTYEGTRYSTSRGFLTPIKDKGNIDIAKRTYVERVTITKKTATGVVLNRDGKIFNVAAKKEVILSAGAINTPKILMLSGIGPKNHLSELGIDLEVDLPVGENLVDHTYISTFFKINKNLTMTGSKISSAEEILNYSSNRTGAFASSYGVIQLSHFHLNGEDPNVPDIQSFYSDFYSFQSDEPILQNTITKLRPKSVGSVRLRSSDPYEMPLINPNYFDNPVDFSDTVKACVLIVEMMMSKTWADLQPKLYSPGNFCKGLEGEEYCTCVVKHYSKSMYHPTGTARMATNSDEGVVTPSLKVRGISNLRVIDASIMPNITSGNTNAATIMIGEKGADIIKKQWKKL